jgi:hypothetical protein
MASKGNCCCPDSECPSECTAFFAAYYDASISFNGLTKVIRINQGIANLCRFYGGLCWNDASEKLGDLTIEIEPGYTIPAANDCFAIPQFQPGAGDICDREVDYSLLPDPSGDGQVTEITRGRPAYTRAVVSSHTKAKLQRWGNRRYRVEITLSQITGTSMRIRVDITSSQAIRYSVSCCTQAVYAILTCPACADRTCVTTVVSGGATGTVCTPNPYTTPACTLGSWIGYSAIDLAEPIDPFGTVASNCSSVPSFPWNPALPTECSTDTFGSTSVTIATYACVSGAWVTGTSSVTVATGTVCDNDSVSHYCPNSCNFAYCLTQEDTEYFQSRSYFSEPFACTSLCGAKAVYRDTPQPEITGHPTGDYAAGETTDADCVTYYGSLSQKRKYIAWPATFNVTVCT